MQTIEKAKERIARIEKALAGVHSSMEERQLLRDLAAEKRNLARLKKLAECD